MADVTEAKKEKAKILLNKRKKQNQKNLMVKISKKELAQERARMLIKILMKKWMKMPHLLKRPRLL